MEKKRPKGVTILGWLNLAYSFFGFFVFCIFCIGALIMIILSKEAQQAPIELFLTKNIYVLLANSAIAYMVGRGLLVLKNFTRILAIWLGVYHLLYATGFLYIWIATGFYGTRTVAGLFMANISIASCVIFYLTRPKVKEMFQ